MTGQPWLLWFKDKRKDTQSDRLIRRSRASARTCSCSSSCTSGHTEVEPFGLLTLHTESFLTSPSCTDQHTRNAFSCSNCHLSCKVMDMQFKVVSPLYARVCARVSWLVLYFLARITRISLLACRTAASEVCKQPRRDSSISGDSAGWAGMT